MASRIVLTKAQTSAAMVAATRQIKTTLGAFKRSSARSSGAGWDERACVFHYLEGISHGIASAVSYGGYAVSYTWQMLPDPAVSHEWIKTTTHAAACQVGDGSNLLREYRGLQQKTARRVAMVTAAHACATATEDLYDLLLRQAGMYRVRFGDATAFLELLAACCKELARTLEAEARHAGPVLGGGPAGALAAAARSAAGGGQALRPVIPQVRAGVAALPSAQRRPGKLKAAPA